MSWLFQNVVVSIKLKFQCIPALITHFGIDLHCNNFCTIFYRTINPLNSNSFVSIGFAMIGKLIDRTCYLLVWCLNFWRYFLLWNVFRINWRRMLHIFVHWFSFLFCYWQRSFKQYIDNQLSILRRLHTIRYMSLWHNNLNFLRLTLGLFLLVKYFHPSEASVKC